MGKRLIFSAHLTTLAIVLSLGATALAQEKERPKLKNFGSSLKKTKSDPKKKPEVESKPNAGSKSESDDIEVIKVETSLVTSDFLVLDARGNPVSGLTDKDFVITEDGQPQSVGMLMPGDNIRVPRTIVLVIDYSGSQKPYIKNSIAAAKALVDKLPESDSMAIVTDDVELIQDFTTNKHKLKGKLDSLLGDHKFGRSQQFSALMATLNEAFNVEDQRPIVIFQTDGDQLPMLRDSPLPVDAEPAPTPPPGVDKKAFAEMLKRMEALRVGFSLDDICRAAEKARATIYTVVPGHQILGRSTDEQLAIAKQYLQDYLARHAGISAGLAGLMTDEKLRRSAESLVKTQAALATVSTVTGGWTMFLEKPEDADHIYDSIFSDINRRYIVGYYPTNKAHDGKRRKIDITIRNHPDYVVVGRRWYYAPAPNQ
jgi:VWFA-related protein